MFKKNMIAAAAAGLALASVSAADAAGGCGRAFHRGPHGHCVPNREVVVAPGLVIGNFYAGHGYWDGHRYWRHRFSDRHGGWRYR
jgi:hypothetical protein